jgi:hypothetical protein
MPIYATLNLDWTANYTNIHGASQLIMRSLGDSNPLLAYLDETDQSGVTGLLAPGQDTLALMQPPGLALSTFILAQYGIDPNGILNTAINFTAVNSAGDFTGGNAANTLRINLYCDDVPHEEKHGQNQVRRSHPRFPRTHWRRRLQVESLREHRFTRRDTSAPHDTSHPTRTDFFCSLLSKVVVCSDVDTARRLACVSCC